MMNTSGLRKAVGNVVFNRLVKPPERENSQLVFHGADYGHAYLYEEIFCRDASDISAAIALVEPRPGAVLDLAGGAGRFSMALVAKGREVALVDKSVAMLEIARRRKKALPADKSALFRIYPQDIAQLQIGREFVAIFSINNGLEHLKDESAIAQALGRAAFHLHPEGDMYLDVHYPPYWENRPDWKTASWEYAQDFRLNTERYRVWGRTRRGTTPSEVIWEHAVTKNLFDYTFLKTALRLYPAQVWHKLITAAGLKVVDIWGDWAGRKLDVSLPKMIFHVKRV